MALMIPDTLSVVTVAAAGTAVALGSIECFSFVVQAETGNTGNVFIGDSTVDSTTGIILTPGSSINIGGDMMGQAGDFELSLANFYVDAATNGDKVRVFVLKRG